MVDQSVEKFFWELGWVNCGCGNLLKKLRQVISRETVSSYVNLPG
jgi:hypothetical protein